MIRLFQATKKWLESQIRNPLSPLLNADLKSKNVWSNSSRNSQMIFIKYYISTDLNAVACDQIVASNQF